MDVRWNNRFLYKHLVHHPIETTIYKWLALGFQDFMTPETAKFQTAKVKSFTELPQNGAMSRGAIGSYGVFWGPWIFPRKTNECFAENQLLENDVCPKMNPFLGGNSLVFGVCFSVLCHNEINSIQEIFAEDVCFTFFQMTEPKQIPIRFGGFKDLVWTSRKSWGKWSNLEEHFLSNRLDPPTSIFI